MKALIVTDVQNDFLPGGSLAVKDGDAIIPVINRCMEDFEIVIATQDWHPRNHLCFASNHEGHKPGDIVKVREVDQILWPDHCIQETYGAELSRKLNTRRISKIFRKGTNPFMDSYSTFFDNGHQNTTGLAEWLHERKIKEVYIVGLATDYCIKYSALDAVLLKFQTFVITDGCRGVNLEPHDSDAALAEMERAGVKLI